MSTRNLKPLLQPRSIALIGASVRAGSVGATVWRNLRAGRFDGPIWAVNPKHGRVDDEPAYASPADLPQAPDLALICTPPATVPGIVDALGRRGTRAAVVLTAGLGHDDKTAMLDAARPHLLRILGPNCLGLLSPHVGLNASFAHADALSGNVAFVSQSGALVTAVLDWSRARRIGFSHLISVGESADVDFGDLLDHLAGDAHTRAILLYMESIEAPRKFMSAARAAARNKPVIVIKGGREGHGIAAAASHTGALAGADLVYDAAIRRAGMLRVNTLQELFIATQTLARFSANRDETLTIMTNGGGAGVMAADAAERAGLQLTELGETTMNALDQVLPSTWSWHNPIDIIGDAPVQRYVDTLRALLADPSSGALLFAHAPTAIVPSTDIARSCAPIARQASGRILASWLGDASVREARQIFEDAGVACYDTPEDAVRAFSLLLTYRRNQAQLLETPSAAECAAPDAHSARAIVAAVLADQRAVLNEPEAKSLLRAYGVRVVETVATEPTVAAALSAAEQCGYPVVLKILSPELTHKSDVDGVHLNIATPQELASAAEQMLARVRMFRADARLQGFSVQPMVNKPHALELIVGATTDSLFGPVLLFGHGGTAVEAIADRALALPPMNRALAREMISRTRVARLLEGYRSCPAADLDAIADVLIAVSQLMADLPEVQELDINPLWADADGVIALDARVRVQPASSKGTTRFAIAPYPSDLSEQLQWQGREITLRPVRPEDESQHRAFVERLTADDFRKRFFTPRRTLEHSELARLVQIDYDREMAFIAVADDEHGQPQTLGVVRSIADPDNIEAELGILIRADLQGRGLGNLMLDRLIRYLRSRGTERLVALTLPDNEAMRKLALTHGFVHEPDDRDSTVQRLVKKLV